jgi:LysM repeat protein
MYQNSITDLPRLEQDRYENILEVYQDKDDLYFYNLLQTVVIPDGLPDAFFNQYAVVPGDTLPLISYKAFKSISMWWIICSVNGIIDPTITLEPGRQLKIPKNNMLREILTQINNR